MERAGNTILVICALALASGLGYLFQLFGFPVTSIAFVYLLAVLLTAWKTSSPPVGLLTSIAATCLFNFFFVDPRFTLAVYDPNYYVTFLALTITSIVVSTLTTRARKETQLAYEREEETKSIYMLTNRLSDAGTRDDIVLVAITAIRDGLQVSCGCLCLDSRGKPEPTYMYLPKEQGRTQVRRETEDPRSLLYQISHLTEDHWKGEEFCNWPLYGEEGPLGIIRIPRTEITEMDNAQKRLLHSMIDSIALALDRFRSSEQKLQSREEAARERYRANLLRSISHDIRTPLTGIIGTSEILRGRLENGSEEYMLAGRIQKDAEWLHSLVENILGLTRLRDGGVKLKKEMEVVEEIVGVAVSRVQEHWPNQEIRVQLPEELVMAPMDAKLIEQVIINLLENAIKHTSTKGPVSICVGHEKEGNSAVVSVRDWGDGIPAKDLPHIFQPFYTSDRRESVKNRSFGLGLAICQTIVEAHGGSIRAHNCTDGEGAEFTFSLPMEVENDPEE